MQLARLAATACAAPMAVICRVQGQELAVLAEVGLPDNPKLAHDMAGCVNHVRAGAVFEVADALKDPSMARHPAVTGALGLRFCAGAPIKAQGRTPAGAALGAVCVQDSRPRTLSASQARMLQSVADLAWQVLAASDAGPDAGAVLGEIEVPVAVTPAVAAPHNDSELLAIFEHTPSFIVQAGREGGITYMNPAVRRALGIAADAPVAHLNVAQFNTPQTNRLYRKVILPAVQAQGVWQGQTTVLTAGQRVQQVDHMVIGHRNAAGELERYSAVMRDIEDRLRAAQEAERQTATLRSIAETLPDMLAVVGIDGRYRFVNSSFEQWFGAPRKGIVGRSLRDVVGEAEYAHRKSQIDRVLAGETVYFEREFPGRKTANHLAVSYLPLRLSSGEIDGFISVSQDITHHKLEHSRLWHLAQRDTLTGLLNRAGFESYLEERLRDGHGPSLALLYIDLDHFKPVNDEHGHMIGDLLLQQFAQQMQALVRPTDAVARVGGDEFAIVLAGVRERDHAQSVADKLVAAAATPYTVADRVLHLGVSIGVAFGADPATGWRDLLARADAQLYKAKHSGRGRHAGTTMLGDLN